MLFALLELVPKKANGRVSPEYRVARVSGAAKRAGRWVRASAAVCRVTAGTKGMQSAKMRMRTVRGCMVVVCEIYMQWSSLNAWSVSLVQSSVQSLAAIGLCAVRSSKAAPADHGDVRLEPGAPLIGELRLVCRQV